MFASILATTAVNAFADLDRSAQDTPRTTPLVSESPERRFARDWSFQFGIGYISGHNIGEIFAGKLGEAQGDAGGEIYNVSMNWVAHRFAIPFGDRTLSPQFEPYAKFSLVDENGGSPFPDYNAGIGFRWVDFPWNRWLKTTFFTGVGLSYSSKVFAIDRVRHPGESRSHLKFDWPIQATFALPHWPEHQFLLFIDHQSGGHIFDAGGANSLGLGYRVEF